MNNAPEKTLRQKWLDIKPLQIKVYSDGSFSGNDGSPPTVGYMIFLKAVYNNANLIDCKSIKTRLVIRYVLGEKPFSLSDVFGTAIFIKHDLKHMLGNILKPKTDKRLMIDIKAARESYND